MDIEKLIDEVFKLGEEKGSQNSRAYSETIEHSAGIFGELARIRSEAVEHLRTAEQERDQYESLLKESQEYHRLSMISIAKLCGEDVSDEPRLKWVYSIVSDKLREIESLRAQLKEYQKLYLILNPSAVEIMDWESFGMGLQDLVDENKAKGEMLKAAQEQESYGWDSAGDLIFSIDDGVNGVIPVPLYAAPIPAQQSPAVVVPDNLQSHRGSWICALERLVELEPDSFQPDRDDKAYWCHELQAMRDMYADLDVLLATSSSRITSQQSPAVAVPDEPKNPGAAYMQTFLNDARFDAAVNAMPDNLIEKFYSRIVERTADRDDWKLCANNLEEDIAKPQAPRITEQDAREIAISFLHFWNNDQSGNAALKVFDTFVVSDTYRALLNKLNGKGRCDEQ